MFRPQFLMNGLEVEHNIGFKCAVIDADKIPTGFFDSERIKLLDFLRYEPIVKFSVVFFGVLPAVLNGP